MDGELSGQRAQDSRMVTVEELHRANADPGRQILFKDATVLTMDPDIGDFARGDVLIRGGEVAEVGPAVGTRLAVDALVIDGGGSVLIPGFVDTHRHCWQGQLRQALPNADIFGYKALRDTVAVHYKPEDHYAGTLVSALAALNSGITCLVDVSHNSRSRDHTDAAIDALRATGIRGVHASAPPEVGDWQHQWPQDLYRLRKNVFSSDDQLLTLRMAQRCADPVDDLSPARLEIARDLAIGVSVDPVAFTPSCQRIADLAEKKLLGPDIAFIHCVGLDDHAWQAIAAFGVGVCLSPMADSLLGFGPGSPSTLSRAFAHQVTPGLSVDVEPCLSNDMFSQMRNLLVTHRQFVTYAGPTSNTTPLTARALLNMATQAGAHAVGLGQRTGSITPGKQADLILINATNPNLVPMNNAYGAVTLGASPADVDSVLVGGMFRKWDGRLLDFNPVSVSALAEASRDRLMEASGLERNPVGDKSAQLRLLDEAALRRLGGTSDDRIC